MLYILNCPCGSQGAQNTQRGVKEWLDYHIEHVKIGQSITVQPDRRL